MQNITKIMNSYRECVRNLWNVYLQKDISENENWNERDKFEDICNMLFTLIILSPISKTDYNKAVSYQANQKPISFIKLIPIEESGVPILINREKVPSGYWDYPVNLIKPQDVDLCFIDYFDFDVLGFRDFEFFRARIIKATDPDLMERDALLSCKNVNVVFDE